MNYYLIKFTYDSPVEYSKCPVMGEIQIDSKPTEGILLIKANYYAEAKDKIRCKTYVTDEEYNNPRNFVNLTISRT